MANIWFETNKKRIQSIKRQLIEYNYAGSYGGSINLMEVNNIIDGLLIEITKLDREMTDMKNRINAMNKKLDEATPKKVDE
jgi:hypothetical protein